MAELNPSFYSQWRAWRFIASELREGGARTVPEEKLLQQIWHHQRLLRDQLKTFDGRVVKVLHPGFWNREAGPDFRSALVQIGAEPPRTGDIEIDLHPSGWRTHRHHTNLAYINVLLHVVWEGEPDPGGALPVLALNNVLDAPLAEMEAWLGTEAGQLIPESLKGQCFGPLQKMPAALLHDLLRQAAEIRLKSKASQFHARARQAGWEQALWEGLFSALGYKNNVWPMRRLAELLPRIIPSQDGASLSPFALQARLLGVSALLPNELPQRKPGVHRYLRSVWDLWWREREEFAEWVLPRKLWRLHGLRPANHPQRRLALAGHWLVQADLPARIETWFAQDLPDKELVDSLMKALQIEQDPFWSWHWTLRSTTFAHPQPLLGPQRLTDLAVNVILPWLWIRAVTGKNEVLRQTAQHRYFAWPSSEDNAVLRLARRRLFGDAAPRLGSAAAQQGLLQIVRDFCDHSNARCDHCPFPELIQSLPS